MNRLTIYAKAVLVLITLVGLVFACRALVKQQEKEFAHQRQQQAEWYRIQMEVHEETCFNDDAITEEWMKHQACSEVVKAIVTSYNIVGQYPVTTTYLSKDMSHEIKIPSTRLLYRLAY